MATSESYTYDSVGNRLSSLGVSPYSYNSSNHLTSIPAVTFTYDDNGNTTTKNQAPGTTSYAWDFENRLTSVTLLDQSVVSFAYDPFGRRIKKSSGSSTTIYVYDAANLLEEVDAAGVAVARYTQGLGIDEPLAMLRGGVSSYYQADGLGSITSLTDSSGALAASYTYDSFGNLTASTGTATNPFRYTARELDVETGLYYYRARYFDQSTGRFLSEDPIGFGAGPNFYTYVRSNPINLIDSSGLQGSRPEGPRPSSTASYYICCKKGRFAVCPKNPPSNQWERQCQETHERQHIGDLNAMAGDCRVNLMCAGKPDGEAIGLPRSEAAKLECRAYCRELRCLWPAPRTQTLNLRRLFVQRQVERYCGATGCGSD